MWCINSSFMLGVVVKLSLSVGSWISVCFMALEFVAAIVVVLSSTYFRFEKLKFKKICEKNHMDADDERPKTVKKKQEKNILVILFIVMVISLIAAI
ncbi:MAG: hypothetical protein LBR79_07290 [Oscillospiraceae bacterium]|nr:hypothetical protein [Oscillospiraceae bacterium]